MASNNSKDFKWRHFKGFEIMRMFKKGQFNIWMYGNRNEVSFINQLFHIYF